MHYGISLPDVAQPVIEAQIMMRRRTEGRMIDLAWVFAKTTRRLHRNKNIAVHRSRNKQCTIIIHYFSRSFTPVFKQLCFNAISLPVKKLFIISAAQFLCFCQLLFSKHGPVVSSIGCQFVNKRFAVIRNIINLISPFMQRLQNKSDTFYSI